MRITPELVDDLAELSRLHEASRRDPRDPEIQIHYQDLRHRVPRELVNAFDLRRRAGQRAFAPLTAGVCGACFVAQPISRQFGLSEGERLITCHACGVVFFDPLLTEDNTIPTR